MDELYCKGYYERYKFGDLTVNYKGSEVIGDYFNKIANIIVEEFAPKTVLDCGCAMGGLVLALRNLGVEAYGIDISEYAIDNVPEKAKPFCFVGSISKKLPDSLQKKYDLVVCSCVIECLPIEECEMAIKNLCSISNIILFGSFGLAGADAGKADFNDCCVFSSFAANCGVYRNVKHSYSFESLKNFELLTFQKSSFQRAVVSYEQGLNSLKNEIQSLKVENSKMCKKLLRYSKNFVVLKKFGSGCIDHRRQIKDLEIQIHALRMVEHSYKLMLNSTFWKCTLPFRLLTDLFKKVLKTILRAILLFCKGIKSLIDFGFVTTFYRVFKKQELYSSEYIYKMFRKFVAKDRLSSFQLKLQKNRKFRKNIKFSVIVPLYNTPMSFLKDMIDSVVNQTYSNWQLCLADGSDCEDKSEIEDYCKKVAKEDDRIVYQKLEENKGISENTNAALRLATGEYVAMLDHDDLLAPSALFEYASVLEKEDADFMYSDELTFEDELDNIRFINFKPDFSPDFLCTNNYICHLSVFSVELLNKVGYYSKDFDGSQDYDMTLRLTEKAKNIVHIPKLLYYWRATSNSVAKGVEAKFYCIDAAMRAISEHLERMGEKATVEEVKDCSSIYRVKYELKSKPKISIIIANKDSLIMLNQCINSVLSRSTYTNFEIIIIENNSCSETLDYYKVLEHQDSRIRVVYYDGEFNYSAINNFGVSFARGEYFLLLNNDTKVITPNWIEEMLMFAQRDDVGAVGAKLYYEDDTIQHAGVIVGLGGVAGHAHRTLKKYDPGYAFRAKTVQNLSAVTAACLMVSRKAWHDINGFDEAIKVAFNDVDFCLRLREAGYLVIFTPHAELYHFESKSRGKDDTFEKQARFIFEVEFMKDRWREKLKKDPYYNPNLSLNCENFLPNVV